MALGVVKLFDVVAILSGGVVTTLGHGATTLGVGASTVGGVDCCPAMIAASSWTAWMCLIFSAVNVGTEPPNTLRRSAAAAIERLCCKATGTWQWAGYKCQVLEKRKWCVAGSRIGGIGSGHTRGGSDVEAVNCMRRPGCLGSWIVIYQCFGS
jgi:hypothetical protein